MRQSNVSRDREGLPRAKARLERTSRRPGKGWPEARREPLGKREASATPWRHEGRTGGVGQPESRNAGALSASAKT